MKIRNLMAPVVALAVCGTVATAQAQQPTSNGSQHQGQDTTNRYQGQDTSQNRAGGQQAGARQHVDQLLEGITLTAQQRTKVDSIVQKFASAQPSGMNQGNATEEPQDTVGRRSDTTTSTSTYGGQTGVNSSSQNFSQLDAQVRAVLTPEQQNIWDRNVGTLRNQGNPKK